MLDKIAIIIGAETSAYGQELSMEIANKGYKILLVGSDNVALIKLSDEVSKITETIVVQIDYKNSNLIPNFASQIKEKFGKVDLLINLHFAESSGSPIFAIEPKLWYENIQQNIHFNYLLIYYFHNLVTLSDNGMVIFINNINDRSKEIYKDALDKISSNSIKTMLEIYTQELTNESMKVLYLEEHISSRDLFNEYISSQS